MIVPLAEHFHSIQGEGYWVGTPMHFLRLAGCSVGRYIRPNESIDASGSPPILPTGKPAWQCHRWDGQPFWCDTDFNLYEGVDLEVLLEETWEDCICLTGGEPMMHHKILPHLLQEAFNRNKKVHIETSGTIDTWDNVFFQSNVWFTVSPKKECLPDMIETADEIKLLVDGTTFEIPQLVLYHPLVYVSPINYVDTRFKTHQQPYLKECLALLKEHPEWRLSVQLHKYLGMR